MGNYADPEECSWSQPGLSFKRITPFSIYKPFCVILSLS